MLKRIFQNWLLKLVVLPIAVLWALGWSYVQINYPTCTFRYKLTAEVMTPDGLKSGSSVVEVSYQRGGDWGGGPHPYDSLLGEATYVDLGAGKNLFITLGTLDSGRKDESTNRILFLERILNEPADYLALTGSLDPLWLPIKLFELGRINGQERDMCKRLTKFYGKAAQPVPLNNLPTLVTFSDLHNPLIARIVNPNDLAATFGTGYSLSTKIQITTSSISDKMYEILPWLKSSELEFFPNNNGFSNLARWNFYKFKTPGQSSYLAN